MVENGTLSNHVSRKRARTGDDLTINKHNMMVIVPRMRILLIKLYRRIYIQDNMNSSNLKLISLAALNR